jgi:glucose-6-phosphate isomerase
MRINLSRQNVLLEKIHNEASKIHNSTKDLQKFLELKNYSKPESFVYLPFDEEKLINLIEIKKKFNSKKLSRILVIGIGGSTQGTKAIYELMRFQREIIPMDFVEQVEGEHLTKIIIEYEKLHFKEFLCFLISKSGGTTETLYNYEILSQKIDLISANTIIITDDESHLKDTFQAKKHTTLPIPKKISGRFSVFSNVGLAPLMFAGVNIIKLLEGAMIASNSINEENENFSLMIAASKYLSNTVINENLYPSRHFGELGKWEKQLFNESLGKTKVAPFTSFGNFFLENHSSLQFYLNSQCLFLNSVYFKEPNSLILEKTNVMSKNFQNSDTEELRKAIHLSILRSLENNQIPIITSEWNQIDEIEIGNYMQMKMLEVYYYSQFLNINAFDQPDVASYKENLIRYI